MYVCVRPLPFLSFFHFHFYYYIICGGGGGGGGGGVMLTESLQYYLCSLLKQVLMTKQVPGGI